MPVNYTADPTADQTPGDPPDPENFPIVQLPVDGDPLGASSVAQAPKILADYIAWLKKPFAKTSQWGQAIRAYRNARLQRRFAIDHLGFPAGQLVGWDEDWTRIGSVDFNDPPGTPVVAQAWTLTGSGGFNVATTDAGAAVIGAINPLFPVLNVLLPSAATTNEAQIRRTVQLGTAHASIAIAFEWSMAANDFSRQTFLMGMKRIESLTGLTTGVWFRKEAAHATWRAVTMQDGSATTVDTGINVAAVDTFQRFRVELVGDATSDDSTARAIFYVNGAIAANLTATLPFGSTVKDLYPFFGVLTTTAGGTPRMYLGPNRYRQNSWTGDTLF